MNPTLHTRVVKCVLLSLFTFTVLCSSAQPVTPSHSFIINPSADWAEMPAGSAEQGCHIFPNGQLGIQVGSTYQVWETSGTLTRTINLNNIGFTPGRVIGMSDNNLLLLRGSQFGIMDLSGNIILAPTSTGMTSYIGATYYLNGVELSNGNIALAVYAADGSNQVRVFTKAGAAVSGVVNLKTSSPVPSVTHYTGQIAASTDGTFLFVYTTWYNGIYGVIFNNDGTTRTWPSTGTVHRLMFPATGQDGLELVSLADGSYMLSVWRNRTGNYHIAADGTILSNTITRGTRNYNIGALAINRKAGGGYVRTIGDESIAFNGDGSDDFTGWSHLFLEKMNNDGTADIPFGPWLPAYYDMQFDDLNWYYDPAVAPSLFSISSIRGGSGGYGFIVGTPNDQWSTDMSLRVYLYEVNGGMGTLPVKLEKFQGKKVNDASALEWETSDETGFSHFEVEWSVDGRTFTKAGTVLAAEGSTRNSRRAYNFNHAFTAEMQQKNTIYYRLKMVDRDGRSEYSAVVKINNSENSNVQLYPVPANDHVWVEMPVTTSRKQPAYTIVNAQGQVVLQGKINQPTQKINLHGVKAGMYYLRIGNEISKPFLKK